MSAISERLTVAGEARTVATPRRPPGARARLVGRVALYAAATLLAL